MDLGTIINGARFAFDVAGKGKEYLDKKKAEREAEKARARTRARIMLFIFVVLPIILVIAVMLVWGLPKDNAKTASIQTILQAQICYNPPKDTHGYSHIIA